MLKTVSGSDLKFSRIIAGVMNWGKWGAKLNSQEMAKLIQQCVNLGISSFDHADIYGDHTTEAEFGLALKTSKIEREKIQLISKFAICYPNDTRAVKTYNTSKEHILFSVEQSLNNLQTDYLDVLLIHRPSPIMNVNEIVDTFGELKEKGKVLHFGVSNFTVSQMQLFEGKLDLITNQVEASLLHRDPFLNGKFDHCQKQNIHPMIWSPLKGAQLFDESPTTNRIKAVCNKYNWTLDLAAYMFLLHHPHKLFPITGSSKIARIKTAVTALNTKLSNDQWFELWTAATGAKVP